MSELPWWGRLAIAAAVAGCGTLIYVSILSMGATVFLRWILSWKHASKQLPHGLGTARVGQVLSDAQHNIEFCWWGFLLVAAVSWVLKRPMLPALIIWFPFVWIITMSWTTAVAYLEAAGFRSGNTFLKLILTSRGRSKRVLATAYLLWLLLGTVAMWHSPYGGQNAVIGFISAPPWTPLAMQAYGWLFGM